MNNSQHTIDAEPLRSTEAIQLSQFQSEVFPTTAVESREDQALIKLGVEASQLWHTNRVARLTKLRSMIEAGTYAVNSEELAEDVVKNETHFSAVEVH